MAVVVKPRRYSLDFMAMRLFAKIIKLLGGPRKMIELRRVTWLPSLMEAVYVVLLHELERKTAKEIAATLGLTPQTVQNILRAKPEFARKRLEAMLAGELESADEETKTHMAGALAKLAYEELRQQEAAEEVA
jgi:probable regulatory domain-containing protein